MATKPQKTPFDETNWTDPNGDDVRPYVKSKTLAERAAWDFIANEGGDLELSVVNPVGVFGPVLGPDYSTSILLVQRLMDGAMPGCPRLCFGVVDVRDVADLHIRAMTHPAAKGERFLAIAGDFMSILDIAKMLKSRMGASARTSTDPATSQLAGEASRRSAIRRLSRSCPSSARRRTPRMKRPGACWAGHRARTRSRSLPPPRAWCGSGS